jgi:hypothetical protein
LPSVTRRHSTNKFFVECSLKHSIKIILKNKKIFVECRLRNTRQSFFRKINFSLSSARSRAFGKVALDNPNGSLLFTPISQIHSPPSPVHSLPVHAPVLQPSPPPPAPPAQPSPPSPASPVPDPAILVIPGPHCSRHLLGEKLWFC